MAVPISQTPSAENADRLLSEGLVSMPGIAKLLGELRGGRPVHPSTPYRWATRGVRLPDGSRLRLEALVLSGRPVSSRPALLRFIAGQQPAATKDAGTPPRSPAARNRASEQAAEELKRLGI